MIVQELADKVAEKITDIDIEIDDLQWQLTHLRAMRLELTTTEKVIDMFFPKLLEEAETTE